MHKIFIFAVLKRILLQKRETEALYVYIIFAVLLVKITTKGFWNESVKSPYLCNRLIDFDEISHSHAYWPLEPTDS